ncbi:MAG: exodeoxyribonuclease VII small subunit [Anaerolineaceae bacterium]|nr:exodeoxyribonuclease VII small subunit [Anaerolineaceae bacterium]
MTETQVKINEMDYETASVALQEVIAKLEDQEQTLDGALSLFEEGQLLIKHCANLLDKAELKVQTLIGADQVPEINKD